MSKSVLAGRFYVAPSSIDYDVWVVKDNLKETMVFYGETKEQAREYIYQRHINSIPCPEASFFNSARMSNKTNRLKNGATSDKIINQMLCEDTEHIINRIKSYVYKMDILATQSEPI